MIKTAAELLQVAALRTRTVKVRDAEVCIREMSVRARHQFSGIVKENPAEATALLVSTCVVDENGAPLFSHEEAKAMAEASHEVLDAIVDACLDVSGLKAAEKKD